MNEAPAVGGSYALCLRVANVAVLDIGRLGRRTFEPGIYIYLGSAMGPGGLRARLHHHLHISKSPHWHIDWLRLCAEPIGYWWTPGREGTDCASQYSYECTWTRGLIEELNAHIPQTGFGSTDCTAGCPAHLLFFGKMKRLVRWRKHVEKILTGLSGPVFYCGVGDPAGSVFEGHGAREHRDG